MVLITPILRNLADMDINLRRSFWESIAAWYESCRLIHMMDSNNGGAKPVFLIAFGETEGAKIELEPR